MAGKIKTVTTLTLFWIFFIFLRSIVIPVAWRPNWETAAYPRERFEPALEITVCLLPKSHHISRQYVFCLLFYLDYCCLSRRMSSLLRLVVVSLKKYKWQAAAFSCFILLITHTILSPATLARLQVMSNFIPSCTGAPGYCKGLWMCIEWCLDIMYIHKLTTRHSDPQARPPYIMTTVTIYYCDILTQWHCATANILPLIYDTSR